MFRAKGFAEILGAVVMAAGIFAARPARADQMDRLLELLVKKQVISAEEAASLREEVEQDKVSTTYLFGVNWYLLNWVKLQANYGVVDEEARTNLTNLFLSQVQFQF